jgi:hypothetical protein
VSYEQLISNRDRKNAMYPILVDDDDNDDVINVDLIRDALMTILSLVLIALKMC